MPADTDAPHTKSRLLHAATEIFSTKGFHATTMRDIAGAAGVTTGATYVHFVSKEELLYQICRLGHLGAIDTVTTASGAAHDPLSRLAAVTHALAMWHAEHHTRARVVNYELPALAEEHRAEILTLRRQIFDTLRSCIEEGMVAAVFDTEDSGQAALQILSLCVDVSRWYRPSGRWKPAEVAHMTSLAAQRLVTPGIARVTG